MSSSTPRAQGPTCRFPREEPGVMRLTRESGPDGMGRVLFTLDWTTDDGEARGQYFHAVPEDHIRSLRGRGWTVTGDVGSEVAS